METVVTHLIERVHVQPPIDLSQYPDDYRIRASVVKRMIGIGESTLWRWTAQGKLPQPLKIGPNVTSWRLGDIREYLAKLKKDQGVSL